MSDEQRQKLREFVISRVKSEEHIYTPFYQEGRFYRYVNISCPCGKDRIYSEQEECNEKGDFLYWKPWNLTWKLLLHIEYQIRMNASKFHIDLLKELIGEEELLKKLESFAKKNMLVALALKKYIDTLKNPQKPEEKK